MGGVRESGLCQPARRAGWQSEISVRIFFEKGSDFVQ